MRDETLCIGQILWLMSSHGLLFVQCLFEILLRASDEIFIARRVDEDARSILRIAFQFREQIEKSAMGTEKNVAGQGAQHGEGVLKIFNNAGIAHWMAAGSDEMVLRPEAGSAHDNDVAQSPSRIAWKVRAHGPCRTSAGVACSLVCGQYNTAKAYDVFIAKSAVHMHGAYVGTLGEGARKSFRAPLSSTLTSPSITMFFAWVSRITSAAPPT